MDTAFSFHCVLCFMALDCIWSIQAHILLSDPEITVDIQQCPEVNREQLDIINIQSEFFTTGC